MAVFFTSVYKKYYDNLVNSKRIVLDATALQEKLLKLTESTRDLLEMMKYSTWNEQGVLELKEYAIPTILMTGVSLEKEEAEKLKLVATKSIEELLPLLEELKKMDEEYETLKNMRDENKDPSKIANLEVLIKNKIKEIERKIIEIKNIDVGTNPPIYTPPITTGGSRSEVPNLIDTIFVKQVETPFDRRQIKEDPPVQTPKVRGVQGGTGKQNIRARGPNLASIPILTRPGITHDGKPPIIEEVVVSSGEVDQNLATNPRLIRKSVHGSNFFVVKTAYDVSKYASEAYRAGIRQNSDTKRYGDLCLAFSYVHAANLYTGQGGDNAESAYRWKYAGKFTDFFNDDKKATMAKIYEQVTQGKPVIVQVNGNKSGTSRHFVTVVGFKDTVKGPDSLREEDLLIMDSWDAQIERMDTPQSRFMTTGAQTRKKYSGFYLRVLKG